MTWSLHFSWVLPTLLVSIRDPSAPGNAVALQEVGAAFAAVMAGPAPPSLVNCFNCRDYCCVCRPTARAGSGDEEGVQGCSPEHRGATGASLLSSAFCRHWSFVRCSYEHLLPLQRWRAQRSMEAFVTGREWGGPDCPQPPEHQPWGAGTPRASCPCCCHTEMSSLPSLPTPHPFQTQCLASGGSVAVPCPPPPSPLKFEQH